MPRLCIVAGDPSGDAHAANLVGALGRIKPGIECFGLGGPSLESAGVSLLADLTRAAAIGPFDSFRNIGKLRRARNLLAASLQERKPDFAVLVDFGDYNLPFIAPLLKKHGVPVYYYISPQLWAWGRWRLRYVKKYVDHMLVFFPFEADFYRKEGVPVTWVGHPLVERFTQPLTQETAIRELDLNPWRMTLALLPGSRSAEIRRLLPLMIKTAAAVARRMPGVQFLLFKAPNVDRAAIHAALDACPLDIRVTDAPVGRGVAAADAAIVASGTATLETALAGTPMAIVYKTSWPTYFVARCVLRIPNIGLVNIVAGEGVAPEFLQAGANPSAVAKAVVTLLRDGAVNASTRAALSGLKEKLGPPGAAGRAAAIIASKL